MRSSLQLSALSKHRRTRTLLWCIFFLGPSWQALLMKRWQRHLLMADIWLSVDGHMFSATNALFASYWQFSAWHVPYPSCTTSRTSMRNPHWAPLKSFITTFSPLLTDPGLDGHDFARRPSRAKRDTYKHKEVFIRWALSRNLSQKENLLWSTENPDIEPEERFLQEDAVVVIGEVKIVPPPRCSCWRNVWSRVKSCPAQCSGKEALLQRWTVMPEGQRPLKQTDFKSY